MTGRTQRRRREARGRMAEAMAAWRLRLSGYRIAGMRLRTPFGEIDILAFKRDIAAIVEVKARADLAAGVMAVRPQQRRRIAQAAAWLAAKRPELARRRLRFDIVVVRPWRRPQHVVDAWRPE